MLRRVSAVAPMAAAVGLATATSSSSIMPMRQYRLVPHMAHEVEELADSIKHSRWSIHQRNTYSGAPTKAEIMCDTLNQRERRRNGTVPEKSIARRLSQFFQKDGVVHYPEKRVKYMNITVVNFDGHPFHFRLPPMPDVTLNALIDGTGMCYGNVHFWGRCNNPDCADKNHGDGCMVNVDLETLDRLPPPTKSEWLHLNNMRRSSRADVSYNTRFSCQLVLSEEMDGAVFALKQIGSHSFRKKVTGWGRDDDYATISLIRSKRVEPFAPVMEEPTKRTFAIGLEHLWAESYEELLQAKYPNYEFNDGCSSRPRAWTNYC